MGAKKELYSQSSFHSYLSLTLNSIDYLLLSSYRIIIHCLVLLVYCSQQELLPYPRDYIT
jgi:hypothetical protein